MYILQVCQSLPYSVQLSWLTGPGCDAWTFGFQWHVQKLDSWTGTLLIAQVCAHLSKALSCEQRALVDNEVQWRKYNPRKHKRCFQSHRWPVVCERSSSLTSAPHAPPPSLWNGNYIYLSLLNLKTQWRNSKSSKKTVARGIDLNRSGILVHNKHPLFGRQEVAIYSSCIPDVQLSLHPGTDPSVAACGVTLSRVRCRISLDSACLSSLLCIPLSHSCHCLVIAFSLLFCTWCDFLPSTVINITWEIHWITAHEKHTFKWSSFALNSTKALASVVGVRQIATGVF